MKYSPTRTYKLACQAYQLAQKAVPAYASRFSRHDFTQHQHIAILCIKTRKRQRFEEMEELLIEMPRICEALELTRVPDYSTMCKALKRLRSRVVMILLYLSACLLPQSGRTGIDATGFDRRHASKHYVKRCKIRLRCMKVTFLVDTDQLTILGVHLTVTRKHDTQIIIPLVSKAMERFLIDVLAGDKGYDDQTVRDMLRLLGIRPVIRHREFKPIDKAHNARMKQDDYNQRVKSETVNSMVKRKYSDTLYSMKFWNQVKEVLLMGVVHNIERKIVVIWVRMSMEPDIAI